MNFKLKVVSAAVVCAFGFAHQANALTIVGNSPTTLATEQLPGVATVTLNNIGVNSTTQGVVAGNSYSIRFTLSGGATWTAPGTLIQVNQGVTPPAAYVTELYTPAIVGNQLTFTIIGVAGVSTSAANTFFQLSGATTSNLPAALITSGINDNGCGFTTGTVSITAQYFASNGAEVDFPVGTGNTGPVVQAAQGIVGTLTASVNPILDVLTTVRPGAAPAASKFLQTRFDGTFANVNSAPIGRFAFSNVTGLQGTAGAPAVDYTLTNATDGGAAVAVTASQGWGLGSSIYLIDNTANTACAADPTTVVPTTAGAAITGGVLTSSVDLLTRTLTFPPGSAINDTPANRARTYTVCYGLTGLAGNVPQSRFSGSAALRRTGTDLPDFGVGAPASPVTGGLSCLAPLATAGVNGGIIFVRNYSPVAANAFGWRQQVRIINAGSVNSPISGYFLYQDGTVSPTGVIVANINAGGSATVTNVQIEAAIGQAPGLQASNPRLVLISTTDKLRVQNYIVQPGGNWVEASGGQDDLDGGTGNNN